MGRSVLGIFIAGVIGSSAVQAAGVDVNAATKTQLTEEVGFGLSGPEADAVIAYRQSNGPITSVEQLKQISALSRLDVDKLSRKLPAAGATALIMPLQIETVVDSMPVPVSAEAGMSAAPAADPGQFNINTATKNQLTGDVRFGLSSREADAVIAYRTANGPITSAEQLAQISVLTRNDVNKLKPILP